MMRGKIRLGNGIDFLGTEPGPQFHTFGQVGNLDRLLEVEDDEDELAFDSGSWVLSIRTIVKTLPSLVNTIPIVPLECVIRPAAGAGQSEIICDANASVIVNAPSFTLGVRWQLVRQNTSPGVDPFVIPPNVRVEALACRTTGTGNVHKSDIFPAETLPAGRAFFFDVPSFARDFALRAPDSSLLWLASSFVGFVSGFDGTGITLATWSGSDFQTQMKTRGFVPVPARATSAFITVGGTKTTLDSPWLADFKLGV